MSADEEFTEYACLSEEPDGTRCVVTQIGGPRERALGQFRAIAADWDVTWGRPVFVSRRVTRTPWTDEETSR